MNKIVVIAHDKHKSDLCDFLNQKSSWFYGREIIATGRTAEFLENNNCNIQVVHLKKGKDGGYKEITKKIEGGEISLVFFFRDPSIVQSYHQDIIELLNTCDKKNIPISTNKAAAELLIIGKIRMEAAKDAFQRVNS